MTFNLSYFFFICINFYFFYLINLISNQNTKLLIQKQDYAKLFFGIVTIEGSYTRRNTMYNVWIKKILNLGHDYVYCTKKKIDPKFKWIPLKDWSFSIPKNTNGNFLSDRDRENKRITMAEYFLKTNYDFFINPTDDVFVDPLRINNLASFLKKKYNTNTQSIFLGFCIDGAFLQGGTGYIMSRKMAYYFVKYSRKWLNESHGPDDVEIIRFLKYVNKSIKDATSPFMFQGGNKYLNSINFDPDKLPKCGKYFDIRCNQGINKIEDVYLYHSKAKIINESLRIWNNLNKLIYDKKHRYGWYRGKEFEICRLD